jgi:hypothetical protein
MPQGREPAKGSKTAQTSAARGRGPRKVEWEGVIAAQMSPGTRKWERKVQK